VAAAGKAATSASTRASVSPPRWCWSRPPRRRGEKIAVAMENTLQSHMTAYAQLVRAAIAARDGRLGPPVELFRESSSGATPGWALMLGGCTSRPGGTRGHRRARRLHEALRRGGNVFFYDFRRRATSALYYHWRAQERSQRRREAELRALPRAARDADSGPLAATRGSVSP